MDAWLTLLQNSTLTPPGFDAWEHLNNQGSGTGGPCDGIVLIDGLRILLDNNGKIININAGDINVDLDNNYTNMLLDSDGLITNINNNDVDANIPNDNLDVLLQCGSTLIPKDELVRKVTGANVGGLRCLVTNSAGEVIHADVAQVLAGRDIVGISTQAASIGSLVEIAADGDEFTEPSWNWELDKDIYATEYGHLTQVEPTTDYMYTVALPLTSTSIIIRIEPPIFF